MSQSSEGSEQRRPEQASRDGAATAKAAIRPASAWIAFAVTLSLALAATRANPALDEVQRVAGQVGESYERAAGGSARTADIESVVMVLLGAATGVLLFRRFAWAQRAGAS